MGVVTMFISMAGVMLGSLGAKIAVPEKILGSIGGLAVIFIGLKILIENSLN
jgi:putative Mn2+ efflux pump MntP